MEILTRTAWILAILMIGIFTGSSSTTQSTPMAAVTGTVTYLPRIALPPGAVISVQLIDAARMDAPAPVLAEQTIITTGEQVPFAFSLGYDPAQITGMMRPQVQARIMVDGQLRFISTTVNPVITNGVTDLEIIVSPV